MVSEIKYPTIWKNYKDQIGCLWYVHELDLSQDYENWNTLPEEIKHLFEYILSFFRFGDLLVNNNLSKRFMEQVKVLEVQYAYAFQKMMENLGKSTPKGSLPIIYEAFHLPITSWHECI